MSNLLSTTEDEQNKLHVFNCEVGMSCSVNILRCARNLRWTNTKIPGSNWKWEHRQSLQISRSSEIADLQSREIQRAVAPVIGAMLLGRERRRSWNLCRRRRWSMIDHEIRVTSLSFLNFSLVQLGLSCVQVVLCFLEVWNNVWYHFWSYFWSEFWYLTLV